MVDPVVSSRYGSRPLLDIPAMQVSSGSHQAVSSLQNPVPPLNMADLYDPFSRPAPRGVVDPPYHVHHVRRPHHTAPPPDPYYYNPRDYYSKDMYDHNYYGPNNELVKPPARYLPPHSHYPGVLDPYALPPPPPPPPIPPPLLPPPRPVIHQHPVPDPSHPAEQPFDVTCDLDYGRVARISVRESHGHFRGIPDHIRRELLKAYGKYPFMEVKVRFEQGDYHIYANHDKRPRRREHPHNMFEDRPKDRFYDEEEECEGDTQRFEDNDAYTDGIRPKKMGAPRGILREPGWNNQR